MFSNFSKHRCNYKTGQIFPFLIAIVCIVLIMLLITVNLGKIGLFKTDVSNAADAAALSGASVLSGTLLGLGLKSDMMSGRAIESALMINIALMYYEFPEDIIVAIAMYITVMVEQIINYQQALLGDGRMGWTNAKKTAMQYAFQNAGVDEPRPKFEQFLKDAYNIDNPLTVSSDLISAYYDEYLKGESQNMKDYGQSGFNKFLEDGDNGYWKTDEFGDVTPDSSSRVIVTSGYGWKQDDGKFINSDQRGDNYKDKIYDNYVEAKVIGSLMYPLELVYLKDLPVLNFLFGIYLVILGVRLFIKLFKEFGGGWWGALIAAILTIVIIGIAILLLEHIPAGLKMDDIDQQTKDNPLMVEVTKYRKGENVGLWNFQYGAIKSMANAHVFREHGDEDIKPTIVEDLKTMFYSGDIFDWDQSWFDTDKHLFETELTEVY